MQNCKYHLFLRSLPCNYSVSVTDMRGNEDVFLWRHNSRRRRRPSQKLGWAAQNGERHSERARAEQSQEKKSMSVLLLRRCRAEWRRNFWRKARTKGEREGLREPNVILQQIMEPSNAMPCLVPISLIRDLKVPRPIVNKKPHQMALNIEKEDEKKFYQWRENQ